MTIRLPVESREPGAKVSLLHDGPTVVGQPSCGLPIDLQMVVGGLGDVATLHILLDLAPWRSPDPDGTILLVLHADD